MSLKKLSIILLVLMFIPIFPISFAYDVLGATYTTVDLDATANAKAYLTANNCTEVLIESNNDFLSWGGDKYRHNFAFDRDYLNSLMTEGKLTDNKDVIYKLSDKAISVRGSNSSDVTYTNSVTVPVVEGSYRKIHFLAFSTVGSKTYHAFRVKAEYSDGTSEITQVDLSAMKNYDITSDNPGIPTKSYIHWSQNKNLGSTVSFNADTNVYALETLAVTANPEKNLTSVTFYNGGSSTYANWYEGAKIFALTLEGEGVGGLIDLLPLVSEIGLSNWRSVHNQILDIEAFMKKHGIGEKDFTDEIRQKYQAVKAQVNKYYASLYECIDLNVYNAANSKAYMDLSDCETQKAEKGYDFFSWGGENYPNNFAIDRDSLKTYLDNQNVLKGDKNIPFYMPMDKAITLCGHYKNQHASSTEIDIPDGVYISVDFLALSIGGSKDANFCVDLLYKDGERTETSINISSLGQNSAPICKPKSYVRWNTTDIYSLSDTVADIGQYTVKPTFGKVLDKIIFTNKTESGYLSWHGQSKILALTTVKYQNSIAKNLIEYEISKLPDLVNLSCGNRITCIEKLKESYLSMGGNTDNLSGINRFESALKDIYALCENQNKPVNVYMSPNGNDDNSGMSADSPLKSFEALKRVIYGINSVILYKVGINVILAEGEYTIDKTFIINGYNGNANAPLNFMAAKGRPVINGSTKLNGANFSNVSDNIVLKRFPEKNRNKIRVLNLADFGINIPTDFPVMDIALYSDDKKLDVAQFPNGEGNYMLSEKTLENNVFVLKENLGKRYKNAKNKESFIGGNLNASYGFYNEYIESVSDEGALTVELKNTSALSTDKFKLKIYHIPEELDSPGEWYLDRKANLLYYYPIFDGADEALEIVIRNQPFITLKNADGITFSGIDFAKNGNYAITSLRDGTEKCVSNIKIENCSFYNLRGGISLTLGEYSPLEEFESFGGTNVNITENRFYDIDGKALNLFGGKRISLTSNNSSVDNNLFYRCSKNLDSVFAVTLDYTVGTHFEHNVLHNMPGIALGYGGNNLSIKYNEIYNVMRNATDGGAMYSGKSYLLRGNEIAYNYIHDLECTPQSSHSSANNVAIYLDDGLSGQYVHNNIINNVGIGILFYGSDNKVENNIVANSKLCPVTMQGNISNLSGTMRTQLVDVMNSSYSGKWRELYPSLSDTVADSSLPQRNVFKSNFVDLNPIISSEFQSGAEISGNYYYGMRNNKFFVDEQSQDYRLKSSSAYATLLPNVPNDTNLDINCIGLQNETIKSELLLQDKKFSLNHPMVNETESKIEFSWKNALSADKYRFILSSDPVMKDLILTIETDCNNISVDTETLTGRNYYWKVTAINNSMNNFPKWDNSGGISNFSLSEIGACLGYRKMINIENLCNTKQMLSENEVDKSGLNLNYGNYIVNQTALLKLLDSSNSLSILGDKFKFVSLSNEYKAITTYSDSANDITVPLGSINSERLNILGLKNGGDGTLGSLYITYSDGTMTAYDLNDEKHLGGSLFIPALSSVYGKNNYWLCNICCYEIPTDISKTAVSLLFKGTKEISNALNIFAVNAQVGSDNYIKSEAPFIYLTDRTGNAQVADVIQTSYINKTLNNFESFPVALERFEKNKKIELSSVKSDDSVFVWRNLSSLAPLSDKFTVK